MKKYIWLIPAFLLLSGCSSSKRLLQKQNYDEAINKSVRKLVRAPNDIEEINILNQAYRLANMTDTDRIKFLDLSGEVNIWEEKFNIFSSMKKRQSEVERLPVSILGKINFKKMNYDNAILNSRQKAADYMYTQGNSLLKSNNKLDAREAYDIFQKLKKLSPSYKNINNKINEAHFVGTSQVYLSVVNQTRTIIPRRFEKELMSFSVQGLDSKWVKYHMTKNKDIFYDNNVFIKIKSINISPERISEKDVTDKKSVRDGWKYEYDKNGNVKKDASGNDIRTPKYKMSSCVVTQTRMMKKVMVKGSIEFYDNIKKQIIKKESVATESSFEHVFAKYKGDKNALSNESKKLLRNKAIPFPSNLDMIWQTQDDMKRICKQILRRNKKLLER